MKESKQIRFHFLKFEKGKDLGDNYAKNIGLIMYAMRFENEIIIRYGESCTTSAAVIIETLLAPMKNSWYLIHTKKKVRVLWIL